MLIHCLQPTHLLSSTLIGGLCTVPLIITQGLRLIIMDGSLAASSSVTASSTALRSYGSTTLTLLKPNALHNASRSTFPAGSPRRFFPVVGFYWIAGAVVRSVQQFFLNKHFEKINLEDIIKKNQEKAKKKREKMGIAENQISNAAKINTRKIDEPKKEEKKSNMSEAQRELELEKANAAKSKAKAGSMAAKANMVRDFNEKNSRK